MRYPGQNVHQTSPGWYQILRFQTNCKILTNFRSKGAPRTDLMAGRRDAIAPRRRITLQAERSTSHVNRRSGRSAVFQTPRWSFPSVSRLVVRISSSSEMSIFATKFQSFCVHDKKCLRSIFSVHVIAGDAIPGPKCTPNIAWLVSNTPLSNEL